jgi:hypothetical protein
MPARDGSSGLATGIVITWCLALAGTGFFGIVLMGAAGFVPLLPMLLTDIASFAIAAVVCGGWALRTSAALVREGQLEGPPLREPWPGDAMRAGLHASGWLTRSGQPAAGLLQRELLDAELRSGTQTSRSLVVTSPVEVVLVGRGPVAATLTCVDADGSCVARTQVGAQPIRFALAPGAYRVDIASDVREGTSQCGIVRVWWLVRTADAAGRAAA